MKEKSKRTSTRIISLFLAIMMLVSVMPAGTITAQAKNEVSFQEMKQRAEAIVNYEWTPSSRISTWNSNYYKGRTYFEKNETVKGMPYTLFSSELGFDSLLSLNQYKKKANSNYSASKYCVSVPAYRTGPAYGSCCATFVSEVFGGSFMSNGNPVYDSVNIRNSKNVTTYYNYKLKNVRPGYALSDLAGYHIIWVGDVDDNYITIYEQTPPVARKVKLKKSTHTNNSGYLEHEGKVYSVATISKEFVANADANVTVTTGGASNRSNTSATISGTVSPQSTASSWGFSIGTSKSSLKDYNVKTTSSSLKNLSCDVKKYYGKDLTPGKTYYYRMWAKIGGKKVYGKDIKSFTTTAIKPSKSTIKITKQYADIGIGDSAVVSWSKASNATSYIVKFVDPSGTVSKSNEQKGTTYSFGSLKKVGTYKAYIIAKNSAGETENATPVSIMVHNNVNVTFYDNVSRTVISTQSVVYGHAANAPKSPPQTGYTFVKWDKAFNSVKSNITVNTVYEKKSYTVKFVDNVTNKVLKTQSVKYEEAATAPAFPSRDGYTCTSWSEDFSCIKGNTTIYPVYEWYDSAYSVSADIQSVKRCNYSESNSVNEGYDVEVKLTNSAAAVTRGRLVVALKTSSDKLLATTESSAFSLSSNAVKTLTVFVPYEDLAYKAEVYVLNQFATAGNIAATKSVKIDNSSEWSGWSTAAPPESASEVESRTEYRYRDKEFKTSSSKTLSGYTLYDTTSSWGAYGSWSSWSDTKATASDSRKVETRQVEKTAAYTQYKYYGYYCSSKDKGHFCKYYANQLYGGSWSLINTGWINKKLSPATSDVWTHKYGSNHESQTGCKCPISSSLRTYTYGGHKYYWYDTRTVAATYKTQYRYADRSKVYTYHFYKWGNWSNWSTTSVSATDNRQVEVRTVYRYKTTEDIIEPTSATHNITGNISPEYSGKEAVVYVYKFDQATDYTNEYIGTTKVGENGEIYINGIQFYEEPSIETGDFTVSVAVKGTTSAMLLTTVEAPKPKYTVEFYSDDDVLINTQEVTEGESAELPEAPEKEGYYFTGWSQSTVNIRSDLKIKAEYAEKTFTVVFVDWGAQDVTLEEYKYGEELEAHMPEFAVPDEDTIVEWDKVSEGVTNVTENMVVCTTYTAKEYDADIYDYEGELISSQRVLSGGIVELPEIEDDEAYIFEGWANSETDEIIDETIITEDTTLCPVFTYSETVNEPETSVKTGEYYVAQTISLNCETENSNIYYTTDGTDPVTSDTATEYEAPITIDESCTFKFYATSDKMNPSQVATEIYAINTPSSSEKYHLLTVYSNIYHDRETFYQSIIEDGSTVNLSDFSNEYGYNFNGLYYDVELNNRYNTSTGITDSIILYAKYTPKEYTATFVDNDGVTVIATAKAVYLSAAEAPKVTPPEGYVFSGWDSYDFECLYQDATFTAQYTPAEEYTTVSLDETEDIYLQNRSSKQLSAIVAPETETDTELSWDSSDWSVAHVDSDGLITGVGVGTATITVTVDENGESASVDVNVFQSEYDCKEHKEVTDNGYPASCTVAGLSDGKHCELCGKVLEEQTVIAPLGHSYGENTVPPNCTAMGYTEYTCSVCGDTFKSDYIAPLGHNYEINVKESNCAEGGTITYTCTICGDTYTTTFGNAKGHIEKILEAIEPTCTKTGLTEGKQCLVCGVIITEQTEVAALGHSYISVVTAPTCRDKGYTTYTCSLCGDSYRADYTNTTDEHDYKGVVTKQPTCTKEGIKTFTCSVCGDNYTEAVEKLAHMPAEVVKENEKAATCTAKGSYDSVVYCSVCGFEISRETKVIDKTEHSIVIDEAVAATCEKAGKTEGSHCSVCGEVIVAQKTVKATGHKAVTVKGTPATFKAAGKTDGKKCSVCGKVLTAQKTIAKLGSPSLSSVSAASKGFKATWKSVASIDGYEIQYSTSSSFKSGNKTVSVKGYKSTSKTVKSLKAKKKYYVRIRAYKTINGKKQYSAWSKSKSVTTKK